MVRVDQPWQNNVTLEVENFVGIVGQTDGFPYLLDKAVTNKKTTIGKLPLMVVHGHDVGVFDKKSCHLIR
jgi:hypothetical protein